MKHMCLYNRYNSEISLANQLLLISLCSDNKTVMAICRGILILNNRQIQTWESGCEFIKKISDYRISGSIGSTVLNW